MGTRSCVVSGRRWVRESALLAVIAVTTFVSPLAAQTGSESEGESAVAVPAGSTVESLFVDFLHYARMGRFTLADANAKALLAHPDLEPVKVMQLANRDKKSVDTLLLIIKNSSIGDNAVRVLELIQEGEHQQRQSLDRIEANIINLAGNPQQEFFATRYLAESAEYAVPPMVAALLDTTKSRLRPRLVSALGKMGKPAVSPLVTALAVGDNDVRLHLIRALGEIGYLQAFPYLRELMTNQQMPEATREAARRAIEQIQSVVGRTMHGSAADLFYQLAEKYYDEDDSVRADPRLDTANIWHWDNAEQILLPVVVPERIFGPVMAMRCCQEALRLRRNHARANGLWLAANIRRENRLGLDTESGDPAEVGESDPTRPEPFPRALYFTQAAGARYAHLVLARAVKDKDTAVALGAIEALRVTAGAASLVGEGGVESARGGLVAALRFPDLVVRIRTALALGAALPKAPFNDSEFVVSLLATGLSLSGSEQVLVVDADQDGLNRVAEGLRGAGHTVIAATNFYHGLERVRTEFQSLAGVFVASDLDEPELGTLVRHLRNEFTFSMTPVVVLAKQGSAVLAEEVAESDPYAEAVAAAADHAAIAAAFDRVRARTGRVTIDDDLADSLALESVETLLRIAVDGRSVFDLGVAEATLIAVLSSGDEQLQTMAASVLAMAPTPDAQGAIAAVAINEANAKSLRVSAFASLAESSRNNRNLLDKDQIAGLVHISRDDADLTIRTAASQALGALDLPGDEASEIIRSYYRK